MKTINFYIIDSSYKKIPPGMLFQNEEDVPYQYGSVQDFLIKQIKQFDIEAEVVNISLGSIPSKVDSHLVCFLDQNSIIPADYVARIISMNNLHTNAVCFCGPVFTKKSSSPIDWFISRIANQYKRYSLDGFDSFISCRINNDKQNYPEINGLISTGTNYNKVGGISVIEDRHITPNIAAYLDASNALGDIIYSSRLSTGYFIVSDEFEINNFSKYYYELGYVDGLKATVEDMGRQFTKNNNMLEIESLTWVTQKDETKNNQEYIKHISIFKCLYQLGFFEAFTKTRII